jgi:hypothetical protein
MRMGLPFTRFFGAAVLVILCCSRSLLAATPDMLPAMVGSGPTALINLIDSKHVMGRGPQHGALFFEARVEPNGYPMYSRVWGTTKETEPLRDELRAKLREARFIPATYQHRHVYAWFFGTLAFSVMDGKPHLRIFANQELPELQKENDFIAPQPIWWPQKKYDFAKLKDPWGSWSSEDIPVEADMLLTIDATGTPKDVRLERIIPADKKAYGDWALMIFQQRSYLPAYRNGKPVDSTTHFKFYFKPGWYHML